MCGIAGVVSRDGSPLGDPSVAAAALGGALAHRGPDGAGAWTSPAADVLLVHRRLAIIDPGDSGAQPMTIDGRHTMVFNGEIYNYRELRADLESRGHRCRTASDTEVLLRLLALDGPPSLARARGMFALAWWNADARALVLARDRFGIKPLYVAPRSESIAFASELSALRSARLVDTAASASAVLAFLAWGSVPAPLAWNRGAEMLEPGTWLEWRQDGGEHRGQFADAREPFRRRQAAEPLTVDELRERTGHAVRDSVRAHLVADVPVGVFLSGGIDSGAIVSAAASAGAANLQTFTVTFDDRTSEADRASDVARRFGTRHHALHVDAARIAGDLPVVIAHLDQPTIDGVNTFLVSRAVAATGIKAVLSGAGGDEMFGGYPSFRRLPLALEAKRMSGPLWPIAAAAGRHVLPGRLQTRWRHFASTNGSLIEAYRVQRGFILPEAIESLAGPALRDQWSDAQQALDSAEHARLDPLGEEHAAASVARMESRLYLQSQLLRDMDVMSMAHGLEVRVPFVDHELASVVWPALGDHRRLLAGKALLHGTLARPLPAAILEHPKQGFTLPFAAWMRGALGPLVQDGLQRLGESGWLAADAPARVWNEWTKGQSHWSRPWGLGVLGHFLTRA